MLLFFVTMKTAGWSINVGVTTLNLKKGRSIWYYAVEIRAATGSTLDLMISTLRVG